MSRRYLFLEIPISVIMQAASKIGKLAKEQRIEVIIGSAWQIGGDWHNCGLLINGSGELQFVYPKINLATLELPYFHAGDSLLTFQFQVKEVTAAIQICREVRYPEQWRFLAVAGSKIIFHLNNAQKPSDAIWKHLLVSRAYENQIFVVSVNAASDTQSLPSLVIDPEGNILAKTQPRKGELISVNLDLSKVKTGFINQRLSDVVDVIDSI